MAMKAAVLTTGGLLRRQLSVAQIMLGALIIASCGGGSGGGNPTSPPVVIEPPPDVPADDPVQPKTPVAHVVFVDATVTAGLDFAHGFENRTNAGRVAAGHCRWRLQ